jgi:hypothetical protein
MYKTAKAASPATASQPGWNFPWKASLAVPAAISSHGYRLAGDGRSGTSGKALPAPCAIDHRSVRSAVP